MFFISKLWPRLNLDSAVGVGLVTFGRRNCYFADTAEL